VFLKAGFSNPFNSPDADASVAFENGCKYSK